MKKLLIIFLILFFMLNIFGEVKIYEDMWPRDTLLEGTDYIYYVTDIKNIKLTYYKEDNVYELKGIIKELVTNTKIEIYKEIVIETEEEKEIIDSLQYTLVYVVVMYFDGRIKEFPLFLESYEKLNIRIKKIDKYK